MPPWTLVDLPPQTGCTALVTGANAGIGFETAAALAERGAHVVLACRDPSRAAHAVERVRARCPTASVEARPLDLADLDSVRALADGVLRDRLRLDLLILNAGVMMPPPGTTRQGVELQLGTNHVGHFALTGRLLPAVPAGGRIVVVSSHAHQAGRLDPADPGAPTTPFRGYARSKHANLLFALELHRRLAGSDHRVTAAHPGWTNTDLLRGLAIARWASPSLAMTPAQGALPILRAATDPDAAPGSYWGPGGWFELVGPPVLATPSARARDAEVARRLWAWSEAVSGVTWDG